MYDKLLQIEKRFDELSEKMTDPALIANRSEFEKVAKERAQLETIVEKFRLLRGREKELEDAKEMLSSNDAERCELAKQVMDSITSEIERLNDEIK
ncbi:MAG: PCRF domain-containing protein, partial [Deltaproteobacteria bacterium]|nr:PCRF domain-containing protein [Deltaproteobacteria bacterium]